MISQTSSDGWRNAQATLERYYPGTEPLGWRLRERSKKQWTRFYALSGGELPSDLRKERGQILHRFKEISSYIFSPDPTVVVTVPLLRGISRPSARKADYLEELGLDVVHRGTADPTDEFAKSYDIYAMVSDLTNPALNNLVLEVMRARVEQAMFIASDGNVMAPYEGGFDVMSPRQDVLLKVSSRFSEWRSDRSDGL